MVFICLSFKNNHSPIVLPYKCLHSICFVFLLAPDDYRKVVYKYVTFVDFICHTGKRWITFVHHKFINRERMKQKKTFWLWMCLMCGAMTMQAQEQHEEGKQMPPMQAVEGERPERGEIPSPEKEARKLTNRMKKELGLTDKQYDKIYKLNLKEHKKIFETRFGGNAQGSGQRPPMGGGMGPRGGVPGDGPGMGGPGMGGGRPQMGGRPGIGGGPGGAMRPEGAPRMGGDDMEALKKAAEKKEKKIKKILTGEQYAKWQTMREPGKPEKTKEREEPKR